MAGSISEEDVEKVRTATDIVQLFSEVVPLQQKGGGYWCCCPFHNEKTPSCKIDPARQTFHCWGCSASGDVFSFVKLMDGVDFPDAVRKLAERAHIPISEGGKPAMPSGQKARLKEICKLTEEFFHTQLMRLRTPVADSARAYLGGRSLGGQVPKNWNLGFAPGRGALVRHLTAKGFKGQEMVDADVAVLRDGRFQDRFYDRIMFPIHDIKGECVGFGGRVIGKGEPKYMNSKETPIFKKSHELFGLDKAKDAIASTGVAVVMEGYTDVILAHEAGFRNAVATLGTALTINHIRILAKHAKKRIVYLFDGDEAGQKAIARALQFIDYSMTPEAGRVQVDLCAVTLPDNMDPADYISAYGVEEFRARVDEAVPLLQFGVEREIAKYDLNSPEGRSAALAAALKVLAPIKDSILAKDYACRLAGRLRIREEVALEQLRSVTPQTAVQEPEAAVAVSNADGDLPDYRDPRLRFEMELLSTVACNPVEVHDFAPMLAQISWREKLHRVLAAYLAEAIAAKPGISCPTLVSGAAAVVPQASSILLAGRMDAQGSPAELFRYLYEELLIGDEEEAIRRDREKLAALQASGADDADMDALFTSTSEAQKQLQALRRAHKPLEI